MFVCMSLGGRLLATRALGNVLAAGDRKAFPSGIFSWRGEARLALEEGEGLGRIPLGRARNDGTVQAGSPGNMGQGWSEKHHGILSEPGISLTPKLERCFRWPCYFIVHSVFNPTECPFSP